MAGLWQELMRRAPQAAWLTTVLGTWTRIYSRPDAEGPLAVAEIYGQRAAVGVSPAAIHRVMQDFLAAIRLPSGT
jgi:hypothetical protein